jgi:hypothetical protein
LQRILTWHVLAPEFSVDGIQSTELVQTLYPELSTRRQIFLLKVAQVFSLERAANFAQLSGDLTTITTSKDKPVALAVSDLKQAEAWTLAPFTQLDRGMS